MENIKSARITSVSNEINLKDSELKKIFQYCLQNNWDKTILSQPDGTIYVSGKDKRFMNLKESTELILPYCLLSYNDAAIQVTIRGLIDTQIQMILTDPYASQFKLSPQTNRLNESNRFISEPEVTQRRFMLDSLTSPIQLIWSYFQSTQDDSIFDDVMLRALRTIYDTLVIEQNHDTLSEYEIDVDEVKIIDNKQKDSDKPFIKTGMIWSAYRPDGELCQFNFHIPSQMATITKLYSLVEIFRDIYTDQDAAELVIDLQSQIDKGIQEFGIVQHPDFGDIYVYETDGMGNYLMMDEPHYPNLLSIPYYGYVPLDDEIYQNTRRFLTQLTEVKSQKSYNKPEHPLRELIMDSLITENPLELERLIESIKLKYLHQIKTGNDSNAENALFIELTLTKLAGLY